MNATAPSMEASDVTREWLIERCGENSSTIRSWDQIESAVLRATAQIKIALMASADDMELVQMIEAAVYDAALVSSFRGNWEHVHAVCDYAYDEAKRRPKADCPRHNLYAIGHARSMRGAGHNPGPMANCTCPSDEESK